MRHFSIHQIGLVVLTVAVLCGYSFRASAQQLRADNIDEVVKTLTLEEKCHLVLGCGMMMPSSLVRLVVPLVYPVWVSLRPIALTLSRVFV